MARVGQSGKLARIDHPAVLAVNHLAIGVSDDPKGEFLGDMVRLSA